MTRTYFPALRGRLGDWDYYVGMLPLGEVAKRVSFAREVHKHEELSSFIQRRLEGKRADQIAEYLQNQDQRFFNAIVVGVYEGQPYWHDCGEITSLDPKMDAKRVSKQSLEALGFLSLDGSERLFAIDGQHRLAGIKKAMGKAKHLADEQLAVIMVGHSSDEQGLQKTRRLFTTLNKSAKPVQKGDIIALDEDDVMAICTRRLVEQHQFFSRGQVKFRLRANLPPSDKTSWTTIATMYDLLEILFRQIQPRLSGEKVVPRKALCVERPPDEKLAEYESFAVQFFDSLAEQFKELDHVFRGTDPARAVRRERKLGGGNVLFRPVGQKLFLQVVADLSEIYSLNETLPWLSLLPRKLEEPPYAWVLWNPEQNKMLTASKNRTLARDLLLHMLGEDVRGGEAGLRDRYAQALGVNSAAVELPEPVLAT